MTEREKLVKEVWASLEEIRDAVDPNQGGFCLHENACACNSVDKYWLTCEVKELEKKLKVLLSPAS